MKYNFILLLFILSIFQVKASDKDESGYKIEIVAPLKGDSIARLGKYWNGAVYSIDSVRLSKDGKGVLQSDKKLDAGQYLLYIRPSIQLDILIDKEQSNISIHIDENNFAKSTISGNKDTRLLWDYLIEMDKTRSERESLQKKLKDEEVSKQKDEEYQVRINEIDSIRSHFTKKLVENNKNTWFYTFLKAMNYKLPIPYPDPKTAKEIEINKVYARKHAFDNVNLQDPRLWNTSFLITYIDNYMDDLVDQNPDSLASAASQLVASTQGNDYCFERMLSYLTNDAIKSQVMGRENIWARLFEDYILDKNISWIDSTQYSSLRNNYEKIKNNRIGMVAHGINLVDREGQVINTNDFDAPFTVLYFYSPTCGHCKHETPVIHNEIYQKYKDKGLAFIAIDIEQDSALWNKFIDDNKLTDWVNCSDPGYKSEYWMYYDVENIPAIFVLDKDKKIIAKKLDKDNLEKVLEFYFKD